MDCHLNLGTHITHNATCAITEGSLSDCMQLSLEQEKALYYIFHIVAVLHKTCKHTLMCKVGGVTL